MPKQRFRDPLGHEFEITTQQASGAEPITCPVCGWFGTTNDGGTEVLGASPPVSSMQDEEEE
jgi:hypothetical protein